jgi:hypothetical protein
LGSSATASVALPFSASPASSLEVKNFTTMHSPSGIV